MASEYRYVYDSINTAWDGTRLTDSKDNWEIVKNSIGYDSGFTFVQRDIKYELNIKLFHRMFDKSWLKMEDVLVKSCHVPPERILAFFDTAKKFMDSMKDLRGYDTMIDQFHKNYDRLVKKYNLAPKMDPIVDKFNKTKYMPWNNTMSHNAFHGTYKGAAVIVTGKFVLARKTDELDAVKVYNEATGNDKDVQERIKNVLTKGITGGIIETFTTDKRSLKMLLALNDHHTEKDMVGIYHNEQVLREAFVPENACYAIVPIIREVPDKVLSKILPYFDNKKGITVGILPYGCSFTQDGFIAYIHCAERRPVPQFLKEIL